MRSSNVRTKVGASGKHQAALAALKWTRATMLVHVIVELLTRVGREFAIVARMDRLTFVRFAVHTQRVPRRIVAVHFHDGLIGFVNVLIGKVFIALVARQWFGLARVLSADVIAKVRFSSHDRWAVGTGKRRLLGLMRQHMRFQARVQSDVERLVCWSLHTCCFA